MNVKPYASVIVKNNIQTIFCTENFIVTVEVKRGKSVIVGKR